MMAVGWSCRRTLLNKVF